MLCFDVLIAFNWRRRPKNRPGNRFKGCPAFWNRIGYGTGGVGDSWKIQITCTVLPLGSFTAYSVPSVMSLASKSRSALTQHAVTRPAFHDADTVAAPRTLRPRKDPSGYGQAGSSSMTVVSPSCRDWSSDSAIAAAAPKFPSIWKGGCRSKKFGSVDLVKSFSSVSSTPCASCSLA